MLYRGEEIGRKKRREVDKERNLWEESRLEGGIFLENNNKIQTISLVRKRFKLIWFLTTRVQRGQFLGYKIEYVLLDFPILPVPEVGPICQKLSSCHSFCKTRKRVQ